VVSVDSASGTGEPDDDLIPISALEHYSYCPRQCGLIHVEQVWDENLYTLRGRLAHERVHEAETATEDGSRVTRGMTVWSNRLGLIGRTDVVEFHDGVPYPVEHKVGRRVKWGHAAIQLAAQAMCLEEMLGIDVPRGAIYFHGSRRREEVVFDDALRRLVEGTVSQVRSLVRGATLPPAMDDARCPTCSLNETCLPGVVANRARIRGMAGALFRVWDAS